MKRYVTTALTCLVFSEKPFAKGFAKKEVKKN